MANRKPAGPATKSKNRQALYYAVIGAALCLTVLIGSATSQIVVNPENGHRYAYVRVRGYIDWAEAQRAASVDGGYLATVTDSIEASFVSGLLTAPGQRAFLGASDINDSCDWRWVTGEPWRYQNWAPGEPSGEEPCENSLRTSFELGGKWEADIGPLDGWIVEWNAEPIDTLQDLQQWPVSEGGNGHWYGFLPTKMTWDRARIAATRFSKDGNPGHLATITSSQENDFAFRTVSFDPTNPIGRTGHHWLGGHDDSLWTWVTGEPMIYTNWSPGQPVYDEAHPAVAMVGPPWVDCALCPQASQWVAHARALTLSSIIEFDTPPESTLVDLIQWPVSEGGNGHWYALLPGTQSWDQARNTAAEFQKDGVAGHLATVTSGEEDDFIFDHLVAFRPDRPVSATGAHWLGGHDDTVWTWVTGEPMVYTNWGFGEPEYATANPAVAMVGPPAAECMTCPQPGEWISRPKFFLYGSIVEFDTPSAEPRVILVPEDYPFIQMAIDSARDGDMVLVSPGIYFESLNFHGKNITVRSTEGPLSTTITNDRTVTLASFDHGETHDAVLEGFTLDGGWIAVMCSNSAPTVRHNICVRQNVWNWAAICIAGPLDTIVDPTGDPRYHAHLGYAPAVIENNTIVNSTNGGISMFSITPPTIRNNIVAFNANYGIHQQSLTEQEPPIIGYNDVYGQGDVDGGPHGDYINIPDPGPGAIRLDPLFTQEEFAQVWTLSQASPCINTGDPDPRYNDPDGSRNDMGAVPYENGGGGGPTPTNEWIIVFCNNLRPDVLTAATASVITAYDPDGVLCGRAIRYWEGSYGLMPIYRDDPYTQVDEGCQPGDLIQFKIDGLPVQSNPPVYWTANGDIFEVCEFGQSRCLDIPLHTGWNLISWNVAFESEIRTALDEIIGCVDVVQSYEQGGLAFDPNLDGFNTLTNVDYHHGYWIRMNCDAVLQVCGNPIPSEEWINLEPGWNLVSYWPGSALPVETGFNSIMGSLQEAMGFDQGAQVWLPNMWGLNTLTELRPTHGYWAKVPGFMALSYPDFWIPDSIVVFPPDSGYAEAPLSEMSRDWMSVYGSGITVDGQPVADGSAVTFYTGESVLCGRGVVLNSTLRLTPVYGHDASGETSKYYPKEGDQLEIRIHGDRVYPNLLWAGNGARVQLGHLSADSRGLPESFVLAQNYPNPFNPGTTIAYDVPSDGYVALTIYNVLGQEVRTLVDGHCAAGRYRTDWDGNDGDGHQVSTGVYFYRLTAGETVLTKKMLMLK